MQSAHQHASISQPRLLAGGRGAAVAVACELQQGWFCVTETQHVQAESFGAKLGADDGAYQVALIAPKVQDAAAMLIRDGVTRLPHVKEHLAVFEHHCGPGKVDEKRF